MMQSLGIHTIAILCSSFKSLPLWQKDGCLIYGYGYGYGFAEKAQTCFKNISTKRGKDGDLIGKKCPDFINPMKNEHQLFTQSGTGP